MQLALCQGRISSCLLYALIADIDPAYGGMWVRSGHRLGGMVENTSASDVLSSVLRKFRRRPSSWKPALRRTRCEARFSGCTHASRRRRSRASRAQGTTRRTAAVAAPCSRSKGTIQ